MDVLYKSRRMRQLRPEQNCWNFTRNTYKSQGWHVLDIPITFTTLEHGAHRLCEGYKLTGEGLPMQRRLWVLRFMHPK